MSGKDQEIADVIVESVIDHLNELVDELTQEVKDDVNEQLSAYFSGEISAMSESGDCGEDEEIETQNG